MTLIVETGSGLSDADALVSLDDFRAYCSKVGRDYTGYEEDEQEQAIRRGTFFLSNSFSWQSYRTHGRDQALAWPRSGVLDEEGYGIDSDEIPVEVINACCELAWQELGDPYSLNPVYKEADAVKSEKVGSLAVEYALSSTSAEAQRPELLAVRDTISQFLKRGSSGLTGRLYRGG